MSSQFEIPPPITVEYTLDHDAHGPVKVHPDACARVLQGYGLNDKQIAQTVLYVTGGYWSTTVANPDGHPVVHEHVTYSTSPNVLADGSGEVILNMGSVRLNPKAGVPESALLIPGLSQRADLVLMGMDGLEAEYRAAEKELRRATAIKPIVKNAGGGAVALTADVLADVHDIVPSWAAWAAGAFIVGVTAFWTKMDTDIAFYQGIGRNDAYRTWPEQKRAYQRMKDYVDNPDSPILLSRNSE